MTRNERIQAKAFEMYACMRTLLDHCMLNMDTVSPKDVEMFQLAYEIVRFVEQDDSF